MIILKILALIPVIAVLLAVIYTLIVAWKELLPVILIFVFFSWLFWSIYYLGVY